MQEGNHTQGTFQNYTANFQVGKEFEEDLQAQMTPGAWPSSELGWEQASVCAESWGGAWLTPVDGGDEGAGVWARMCTEQTEQVNLVLEEEVCPGACGQDPSSASLGWEQSAVPGLCQRGLSLHLILNEATPIQVKCLKVSLKRFKVILGHTRPNKTDKKQNLTSRLAIILTCCWINSFLYLPFLFN